MASYEMKKTDKNDRITSVFKFIFEIIVRYRWKFLGLLMVLCYSAIHVSLQPYTVKLILEAFNASPNFYNIFAPVMYYVFLACIFSFNNRFYDYICLKLYPEIKADIIEHASDIVSYHDHSFFQNEFSGAITSKINELSRGVIETIKVLVERFICFILTLSIASYALMMIHPLLSFTLLLYTVVTVSISLFFGQKTRMLSKNLSLANSQANGVMVDRFANILNVRLFRGFSKEKSELNINLKNAMQQEKSLRWYVLKIMALQGIATILMIGGCLLTLTLSIQSHSITIGDFGFVLTMTITIANVILHFSQDVSYALECFGQVAQGLEMLNKKNEINDITNAKALQITNGKIQFKNVNFQHKNGVLLFKNKSITFIGGQKVGLVGYSGGGKSTFINLILRLFDATSGKILIDDQDITQVSQESLHKSISVILQEPTLFHRSIMDNIRYGKLNATDEEIIMASKKAQAHDFIMSFPQGYTTLVGERGVKLSGGERQRIAIARAILKDSPILVMDEATSAMDSLTETLIRKSFHNLMNGKTVIAIAHRLSTLLNMDRIIVLDQGKIVEDGTHKELLQKKGMYSKLWLAQTDGVLHRKILLPEF